MNRNIAGPRTTASVPVQAVLRVAIYARYSSDNQREASLMARRSG